MRDDKADTSGTSAVAASTEKQLVEPKTNGITPPAATPTSRPWTADFLLPSISYREPERS